MTILILLLILLSIGHLGINLVGLPPLLVVENILLAAAYLTLAILLSKKRRVLPILIALLAFSAGRVSRTIWSPVEGFGRLAIEHVPLLLYLLALLILALRLQLRESS